MLNKKFYDAIDNIYSNKFPSWAINGKVVNNKTMNIGFQTYLDENKNRWIVFIPTRNWFNWLFNFIFPLLKIPYGNKNSNIKIHTGFLADYIGYIRGYLHCLIQNDIDNNINSYIFIGHSLGGALARIAAIDINYNYGLNVIVRGFGNPNIGNKEFEESYIKRLPNLILYKTKRDIVPTLPNKYMGYSIVKRIELSKGNSKLGLKDHEFNVYKKGIEELGLTILEDK